MNLLLSILILVIVLLLIILLKNKSIIITLLSSMLILYFIFYPKECIDSTIMGTKLFFYKVFPSLFPFLIISNIIIYYDGVYIYSKAFGNILCRPLRLPSQCTIVLFISALCGYPLGAKYACDLYEKKIIDFSTCERLLNIASNPSPLFVIGAIGTSMLNNPRLGYLLLLINYLSCLLMSIIITPKNSVSTSQTNLNGINHSKSSFGSALKNVIENSIYSLLSIGGFIILFSVLTDIIKSNVLFNITLKSVSNIFNIQLLTLQGLTLGCVEMTNGCHLVTSSNISLIYKVIFISFLLSFSGMSIISQVNSFMSKHNFSLKKYISFKFIQGILSSILALIVYKYNLFNVSTTAFNTALETTKVTYLYILFLIFVIPFLIYHAKKLKKC